MRGPESRFGKGSRHGSLFKWAPTHLCLNPRKDEGEATKVLRTGIQKGSMARLGKGEGRHSNRQVRATYASASDWIIPPTFTVSPVKKKKNELGNCLDIPLGVNLDMSKETFRNCDFLRYILFSFFKVLRLCHLV